MVSHTTYGAMVDMLAGLIIGATCIRVCPDFDYSPESSYNDFTVL